VVLTTSKEENDRVESFKLSVAGYIVKPVEFEKFTQVVKVLDLYWTLSEVPWENS
jgi:DNA-binding response OmpR family regulator